MLPAAAGHLSFINMVYSSMRQDNRDITFTFLLYPPGLTAERKIITEILSTISTRVPKYIFSISAASGIWIIWSNMLCS